MAKVQLRMLLTTVRTTFREEPTGIPARRREMEVCGRTTNDQEAVARAADKMLDAVEECQRACRRRG